VPPLPRGLPVVDHHCHLSPSGEGVGAARRFRAAGGTHLFLATQNYSGRLPSSVDAYADQFETTLELARRVREEAGVVVYPVIAPYPVDLVEAVARLGAEAAVRLQRSALDVAGKLVRERRAVALGEVGRPHFAVAPEVERVAEEVLQYAFEVARDVHCPAVVHCGDLDPAGYRELAELARRAGLPSTKVVKHYARARRTSVERAGVVPSYLARRDLVREVEKDAPPWFLETDYLDDPRRPGAVLDLETVPRRAISAVTRDPAAAQHLWVPFVESVEQVYGWRPEVDGGDTP